MNPDLTEDEKDEIEQDEDFCGDIESALADEENMAQCLSCYGPGVLLGILGTKKHFRCRNCGFTFEM